MLTSLDALVKGYYDTIEDSRKQCGCELDEIRKFIVDFNVRFQLSYLELLTATNSKQKIGESLVDICYLEMLRSSGHILFFSVAGLYRNAFDNLRHMLESIVQALYLDTRHPDIDIDTKIVILKEVEDKFEYHALRLIDSLDIDFKDRLKHEYRELSQIIHPSHKQVIATMSDLKKNPNAFYAVPVDCKEVSRIHSSLRKVYDMYFYLFTVCHPEIVSLLKKNLEFLNVIKKFRLPLLGSSFQIKP